MSLIPWIDETKLDIVRLCMNPNPKALNLIIQRFHEMNDESWRMLSDQEYAKDILAQNLHLVYNNDIIGYNKAYGYILLNNTTIKPQDKLKIIQWNLLCLNETPEAMYILQENLDKIIWNNLSRNPIALKILKENKDKIVHEELWLNNNLEKLELFELSKCNTIDCVGFIQLANTNTEIANQFISDNFDEIMSKINYNKNKEYIWNTLENYNIVQLLINNPHTSSDSNIIINKKLVLGMPIDWEQLSLNPLAICFLRDNLDKVNWTNLCLNSSAILLIKQNIDKIDSNGWKNLSLNPSAIPILKNNIDKIYWTNLNKNNNSYEILIEHPEMIDWNILIETNNKIFKELLQENLDKIDEETLIEVVLSQRYPWKIDMIMNMTFTDDYIYNDVIVDFLANASTELEFKFIKKHFEVNDYLYMLGENPNIFI